MKTKTLILFFTIANLLFAFNVATAQSTVTTIGGTSNYVTKFSGTTTVVNSSIYDNGYVGIGTASPICKFHTAGTSSAADCRVIHQRGSAGGWGPELSLIAINSTVGGNAIGTDRGLGYLTFMGEYNGDAYTGTGATVAAITTQNWSPSAWGAKLLFKTTGNNSTTNTERMVIDQNGYVGIGTTSPDAILHLNGSSGTTLRIVDGNQGDGKILTSDPNGIASWSIPVTSGTAWQLTGNTGTTAGTNFMGTTDDIDVVFKRHNIQAGLLNDALGNTSWGVYALNPSSTGYYNTANGYQALYSNTAGGSNTATGVYALYTNLTGNYNTAEGYEALQYSTACNNTAFGAWALNLTTGGANTAVGSGALGQTTTGSYNVSVGENALGSNTTGSYNTAIGYEANLNGTYSNSTAIGYGAIVSNDNYLQLGNTSVTVIHGQVAYSYSDKRFKFNIQENVKGLDFIKRLRPVTYQMNTKTADDFLIQNMPDSIKTIHQAGMDFVSSTAKVHSGFIAQEVDSVAQICGFTSSIVHAPTNSTDPYALSYEEMVVPLVKSIQELNKAIDSLKTLDSLTALHTGIQSAIINSLLNHQHTTDSLLAVLQNCCSQGTINKTTQNNGSPEQNISETKLQIELSNNSQPILYQNEPNPFGDNTAIRYFIPENTNGNAFIVFYDMYGKELKKTDITTKGFGNINANTENLASGIYSYSLIVNDNVIDTKKMIKDSN